MYRFGRRQVHHYIVYAVAGVLVLALIAAGVVTVPRLFQPNTVLKQAAPVTHTVTANQPALKPVAESVFELNLPGTWRPVSPPPFGYRIYSWAGTGAIDAARRLDVYVDTMPTTLAVNRLLPVQSDGSLIDIIGSVSDNCTNFTDKTPTSARSGQAPSKWGGINFLCDMANYERDVVGVGSSSGINQVVLAGAQTGTHRVLLVYTDNNVTPDYTIFVAIVKSFHLL